MATDLKASFKERHRKRLHETIEVVAIPTKIAYPKGVQEEPMRDVHPMPTLPLDAAGPSSVPTAKKEIGLTQDGALGCAAPIEKVLD